MSYLKYYFGHHGSNLFFDSVTCVDNKSPAEPNDFLKWYEDGDFASATLKENETESESPVFATMFAPRVITFSVEKLLQRKNEQRCKKDC